MSVPTALKLLLLNRWNGFQEMSVTHSSKIYVGFLCNLPSWWSKCSFPLAILLRLGKRCSRGSWSVSQQVGKSVCMDPANPQSYYPSFDKQTKTQRQRLFWPLVSLIASPAVGFAFASSYSSGQLLSPLELDTVTSLCPTCFALNTLLEQPEWTWCSCVPCHSRVCRC